MTIQIATYPKLINHPAIKHKRPKCPCLEKTKKICEVALFILTCMALAYIQPAFFVGGLVLGAALKPYMENINDRVSNLWKSEPWKCVGMATLATIIAFPVVFMAGALLAGSACSQYAFKSRD